MTPRLDTADCQGGTFNNQERNRDGLIKATIWANAGEKGTFHSVDLSRSYKDSKGDWQESTSFSGVELLKVSRLAERAYDEVAKLRASNGDEDDAGE